MSSSNVSNVSATVSAINEATMVYSRCWLFMMVALGMIGHSMSIYVFSRRTLRKNPCAKYFLASTVVGCCIVYGNLPLRTLQMGYQIDVFVYSLPVCKLLSFLTACTRVLPAWFIALACADRFLQSSSSATLRGWSSLRVTRLAIPFTTLLIGLMHIHILVYNTIVQSPLSCVGQSSTYQTFYSFFNLIIWALVPSLGMLIFGLLTIHQYRQGKKRVAPTNTQNVRQKISRSTDRQLIQMMLVQSLVFGLTTSAASFSFLGSLSDANSITDPIGAARKNLIKDVLFQGPIGQNYEEMKSKVIRNISSYTRSEVEERVLRRDLKLAAIKSLKSNKNTIICKVDKGTYMKKAEVILKGVHFQELNSDKFHIERDEELNKHILSLYNSKVTDSKLRHQLTSTFYQ
ncbi:unnamed protein product [Adineta steineri]|uniref:G-protein coupled receptors family 1 profile domain-containing protein n=1 Tax=Adineta steineri TaxID=433720 RepID=A0A814YPA8_9BILA|nr:unnamed protein product [Adineta steineri]CAF1257096.1 unnamed protein product [Adineta steineri]